MFLGDSLRWLQSGKARPPARLEHTLPRFARWPADPRAGVSFSPHGGHERCRRWIRIGKAACSRPCLRPSRRTGKCGAAPCTLSVCTEEELETRYFIRDVLGKGTFGTVYRVIRIEDAEELAVKVIGHRVSAEVWKAVSIFDPIR